MVKINTKYIFWQNTTLRYLWFICSCIISSPNVIFLKKKFKIKLINKMFKLKKYKNHLKPLVHLSSFYYSVLRTKLKFYKKKKLLKIFYKNNKIVPNLQLFIKKRYIDKYTKRGLFFNFNLLLKKKR